MDVQYVEMRYVIAATSVVVASLLFYSIGIWIEHVKGRLRFWHVVLMLIGLVCNAVAIGLMKSLAQFTTINNGLHTLVGVVTILVMMGHCVWAIWVMTDKSTKALTYYNRLSIFVWCVWLVPFFFEIYYSLSMQP